MSTNKDRVSRFASSLALALYDKKIESKGNPVVYFLDADVAINLVMGFEAEYAESKVALSKQRIVRSLLSIGYLGTFYITRPHAFEFYEKIQTKPKYQSIEDREQFRKRAMAYIERTRIREIMQNLHNVIGLGTGTLRAENRDEKIKAFLDILREKSAETFSYIEQINGTWSQRLRRLFDRKLLSLDYLGPEISDLVIDHREILNKLNNSIRKGRPYFTINAFQDASALTILQKYIVDRESGRGNLLVRFYTETVSLIDLLEKDEEIRDILTYKESPPDLSQFPKQCNLIHRDADYLIMRALFRELAPKTSLASLDELKPLEDLYLRLQGLLQEESVDIESAITQLTFQGKSLIELIENYEQISIMKPLWVEGGIPDILKELNEIAGWTKIFQFAKGERTGFIMNAQIRDIREQLESQVSQIRIWTNDFKTILKAREKRLKYLEVIEDPIRDLGLIRWNYELDDDEKRLIVNTIRDLTDEANVSLVASTIATNMEIARKKIKECKSVCAILWSLGRFKEIDGIVEQCRLQHQGRIPSNLTAIQIAARMRAGDITTEDERQRIISRTSTFLSNLPRNERTGVLLSAGYIYYHAWRQAMVKTSNVKDRLWENQPQHIRIWAEKSFELGEEAFYLLDKNTLAWAYAVNHCSYVSIATGVEPERKNEYFGILVRLRMYEELWCSRFDDTVGYYYLDHAEKSWYLSAEEERKLIDISEDLERAGTSFDEAKKRDTGDTDLYEHMDRLSILIHAYEDFKKTTRQGNV